MQYYMLLVYNISDSQFLNIMLHLYYCTILAIFPALYNISF